MGALGSNGSVTPKSTDAIEKSPADLLSAKPEIHDPHYNATALRDDRDDSTLNALKGFIPGTPVIVTWYHQMTSNAATSSLTTTPSFLSNSINTSFLKIESMEIKFNASMDYGFDEATSQSNLDGTCITYPGFTPKIGDCFLYHVSPGKIGLFKISNNPKRFTMHNNTAHEVSFSLFKILETADYTALEERVREVAYFDKQRFLNEDGALITHQELVDIAYLNKKVEDLMQVFYIRYFSSEYGTFLLDGTAYDPYVTNFFRKICGDHINNQYIALHTCFGLLDNWKQSIFATLIGENPGLEVILKCDNNLIEYEKWSSLYTLLHERNLVMLNPEGELDYISASVLSLDMSAQDDFDKLIALFITQNTLSTTLLKSEIETVYALDAEQGFYRIPMLIHLAKLVTNSIKSGQAVSMINRTVSPYINIPFTNEDVVDGFVTIETLFNKILGVVDEEGGIINISDMLITYDVATVIVDLTAILAAKGITEIPDTWNLIASNHLLLDDPPEDPPVDP